LGIGSIRLQTFLEIIMNTIRRTLAFVLAVSLVFSGAAHAAPAVLISTEQAAATVQAAPAGEQQLRLYAALDRPELAAAMQARGVSPEQLRGRVHALTDAEAAQLLAQIDAAPAGGDVLGILFTVFLVLLVTDILGLTKVFPFTRSVR
jgi:hypothetical protein